LTIAAEGRNEKTYYPRVQVGESDRGGSISFLGLVKVKGVSRDEVDVLMFCEIIRADKERGLVALDKGSGQRENGKESDDREESHIGMSEEYESKGTSEERSVR